MSEATRREGSLPNAEPIRHWNEDAGPSWVRNQERLDAQLRAHGEAVLDAVRPAPGEAVLDVGCGCATTTIELARRVGASGRAVGVDVSRPMLEHGRERVARAGVGAELREADAQTAALGEATFDAVVSRFGLMFFEDAPAAFAKLARALRPGGRLGFVCWQTAERNPWIRVPMAALAAQVELPPAPEPGAPGMFALADPARVRDLLAGAGLAEIAVEPLELELAPGGGDVDEAVALFLEVGPAAAVLREAEDGEALRAKIASVLREAFAPHVGPEGLRLGSAAWLVTARRGSSEKRGAGG